MRLNFCCFCPMRFASSGVKPPKRHQKQNILFSWLVFFSSGTKWIPELQLPHNTRITNPQHMLLTDLFSGLQGSDTRTLFPAYDRFEWGLSEDEVPKIQPIIVKSCFLKLNTFGSLGGNKSSKVNIYRHHHNSQSHLFFGARRNRQTQCETTVLVIKCLPLVLWATTLSDFSFFPGGTLK